MLALSLLRAADLRVAKYVYLWTPRSEDVSSESDQDLLRQLLAKAVTRPYTLKANDSPDLLVWKLFLVQTKWPHAFGIYKKAILDLNRDAGWKKDETISVPTGPVYGGTFLPHVFEDADREKLFKVLSYYSFNSLAYASDLAESVDGKILNSWRKLATDGGRPAMDQLTELGVVGPIHNEHFPYSWWSQMQPLALIESVPGAIGISVPVSPSAAAVCTAPCVGCAQILGPGLQPPARAAVMVADTGIDPGITVAEDHLVPSGSADPKYADESSWHHGTYVYRELLQQNGGLLRPQNVYVTKVSKLDGGREVFDVQEIFQAIAQFGMNRAIAAMALPDVLIVNISAAGNDDGRRGEYPASIPPVSNNILLVAAAGNDHETINPSTHIYGQFGGPDTPVLIVGALEKDGATPAEYSDRSNSYVHLLAQGDCVCGTLGASLSGTSQATPVVSTAAALLASRNSRWNVSDIKWRLISTGNRSDPRWTTWALGGQLDYQRAAASGIDVASAPNARELVESVDLDSAWGKEWARRDSPETVGKILRLTDAQAAGGNICFTAIRYRASATPSGFCVDPAARITPGNGPSVRADQLTDLILPVPRERSVCGSTIRHAAICP
jgi:hypothetical protein